MESHGKILKIKEERRKREEEKKRKRKKERITPTNEIVAITLEAPDDA